MKLQRSAYETEPVEDITEAVQEFANAYNRLQDALHAEPATWASFGEQLRAAIHKPVAIGENGLQLSLYEIGVAHAPDKRNHHPGRLSVNREKLDRALEDRAQELKTFFICEESGLIPRLCQLMNDFKNKSAPFDDALNVYWETMYPPLVRFNNECRRLQLFWWE
jgi:flagellar capping protein FliD